MTRTVALATCAAFPDLEAPERPIVPLLAERGLRALPLVWDDPDAPFAAADLVVVRSTWDYVDRPDAFVRWLRDVAARTRVCNEPGVIAWNIDKRYLGDLAAAGLPVVPTTYVAPDDDLPALPDGPFVVKPVVSAGSRDTARYRGADDHGDARDHLARLHAGGRTAMVQPYVASVDEVGETALLYVDGELSHAARKGALLTPDGPAVEGLFAPEQITARQPSAAERAVGAAVLDHLRATWMPDHPPLYARVDLLATDDGPVVLELELTEPSLFLDTDPGAAARFADAIAGRVDG